MDLKVQTALEAGVNSALLAWGQRAQMVKACEEMGELVTQLCKRLNGSPTTDEAVIDEVADVIIMAYSMRSAFGEAAVDQRIMFKLNRVIAAIDRQRKEGVIQ